TSPVMRQALLHNVRVQLVNRINVADCAKAFARVSTMQVERNVAHRLVPKFFQIQSRCLVAVLPQKGNHLTKDYQSLVSTFCATTCIQEHSTNCLPKKSGVGHTVAHQASCTAPRLHRPVHRCQPLPTRSPTAPGGRRMPQRARNPQAASWSR